MIFPTPHTTNARDFIFRDSERYCPGFLTWSTFAGANWRQHIILWVWRVFMIFFDVFWLIKAIYISIHLIDGYTKLKENLKNRWLIRVKKIKDWEKIYHIVIFPVYKEGLEIIRPSIQSIVDSKYPKDKVIVVLTFEERAGDDLVKKRIEAVQKEFSNKFFIFLATVSSRWQYEAKQKLKALI